MLKWGQVPGFVGLATEYSLGIVPRIGAVCSIHSIIGHCNLIFQIT